MHSRRPAAPPPTGPRDHSRRCLVGLGLWLLVSIVGYLSLDPPAPLPANAPVNLFSAGRARELLGRLSEGLESRPAGSPQAQTVRTRILDHLRLLGYEPWVQETLGVGLEGVAGKVHNIIARRNGRAESPVLLCVAHYDSVWAGPGIADDLSGVAVALELARVQIEGRKGRRPIVFLFTDAEEQGLVGSSAFVDSGVMEDVGLVVNFEARGSSGIAYMFETGPGNGELMEFYAERVSQPSASSFSTELYRWLPNDTDFSPFRDTGVPGFNFAFIEGLRSYHTPLDDLEHLSSASLQHEGDQALALIQGWLHDDPPRTGAGVGDAVYSSLPGGWMILYGQGTARALSILALVLLLWAAHRSTLRGVTTWQRILGGLGLGPAVVVAAILLAILVGNLTRLVVESMNPWQAHPFILLAIQCGLLLITWTVVSPWPAGRIGRVACVHGVALWWGLGACASSLLLPGMSHLFTGPALILALLASLTQIDRFLEARMARGLACALPLAALLWIPAQRGLIAAAGPGADPAVLIPLALLGTLFFPLLVGTSGRLRLGLLGLGALAATVGTLATVLLPTETAEQPARLNLVYAQGVDEPDQAHWHVWTFGTPVPDELSEVATFELPEQEAINAFDETLDDAPAWDGRQAHRASAPHLGLAAPRLELGTPVLLGEGQEAAVRVEGTLFSGGSRGRTTLSIEGAPGPVRVIVNGVTMGAQDSFTFLDVPAEGFSLEIWFESADPSEEGEDWGRAAAPSEDGESGKVRLRLVDRRPGLPPGGDFLLAARPPAFVPSHDGDGIMVRADQTLTLPPLPSR